jgi:molybdopterin/thiamine biosynthesis adenylyltransferase
MNDTPARVRVALRPSLAENTSVKLIGLGGVGSIVARYLAIFLGSLDQTLRLVLVDGDSFESSNATRMFFSDYGNKASTVRKELLSRFRDSALSLVDIQEYVTPGNIDRLLRNGDIILLTVDNHATRKLVSDFCGKHLEEVCLISGGNDGVGPDASGRETRGTYGNCQIYIRRGGRDISPSLTQYHPEISRPADSKPSDENCTELVKKVPQLLFANLAAASAILNAFWLYCCTALHYSELSFDIADGLMRPMPLPAPAFRVDRE